MTSEQGGTQLFLLRLWLEKDPGEGSETGGPGPDAVLRWQGKVQHVMRGEAHAFAGWEMLIGFIESMLLRDQTEATRAQSNGDSDQPQPQGENDGNEGRE